MRRTIIIGALALCTLPLSRAASIDFTGTSNAGHTYEYTLKLENHNQHLLTNDSFTIYDFFGVGGTLMPNASWIVDLGSDAPGRPNDPTVTDVTFIYTGAKITGAADLYFGIYSSSTVSRADESFLRFHRKQGSSIVPETHAASVIVADAAPAPVPEPSSIWLTLGGWLMVAARWLPRVRSIFR